MSRKTHNTKAGADKFGSSADNPRQQQQQHDSPDKSTARDREGRKGGSNEKNL
ncbi:MAG: hypothetical protein JF593_04970 [Novosphingobium sp.]|nr:hypothetical protein [Novosphingobium sp.]